MSNGNQTEVLTWYYARTYPAESCGEQPVRVSDEDDLGVLDALVRLALGHQRGAVGAARVEHAQRAVLALRGQQLSRRLPRHRLHLVAVLQERVHLLAADQVPGGGRGIRLKFA